MVTDPSAMAQPASVAAVQLREIDDLPGPRRWPVVGNLLQIKRDRLHQNVEAWAREHGELFQFRLGRRRFLVVAGHEQIATALRDRPDGFRRTKRLEEAFTDAGIPPGVFTANGEVWRRQRRMVMSALDPRHIRAYFAHMSTVTRRLHGRWHTAATKAEWIDVKGDFTRYSIDIVTGLAFGVDVNMVETDATDLRVHLERIFAMIYRRLVAPIPYWRYVKLPLDRAVDKSILIVMKTISSLVQEARGRMTADTTLATGPRNLLEAMLAAADEPGSGITQDDVVGNVLTMLLAGEDTAANTLAWLTWLLHANQHALLEATKEVTSRISGSNEITLEQVATLDFVEACAHEAMRLRPVIPFFPAEAARDGQVGDVRVPAGTVVLFVPRHDAVKNQYFSSANAFNPSRWLNSEHGPESAKRVAIPFGAGPRICPGRYLALVEMKLAMAMLLSEFEIVAVEVDGGGEPQERLSFTMGPVGLRMKLRVRTQAFG
jgi:cytochrome P450